MGDLALAIGLLQTIFASLQQKGAAQETLDIVAGAIKSLLGVTGSDVTYGQLEELRAKATW